MRKNSDQFLLEQAYTRILTEQERLIIEEGKITDFFKSLGQKANTNLQSIVSKVISNPRLIKNVGVASAILIAIANKNYAKLAEFGSDTVQAVVDAIADAATGDTSSSPADLANISPEDLNNIDEEQLKNFLNKIKISQDETGNVTGTVDFQEMFSDNWGVKIPVEAEQYIESVTQSIESAVTNNGQSNVTNMIVHAVKANPVDASKTEILLELTGEVQGGSEKEVISQLKNMLTSILKEKNINIKGMQDLTTSIESGNYKESFKLKTLEQIVEEGMFGDIVNKISNINKPKAAAPEAKAVQPSSQQSQGSKKIKIGLLVQSNDPKLAQLLGK
jgi:hypothetical protein